MIEHKEIKKFIWLFILIILSTALFNVYGFITVPDTPLVFFSTLFLLGYKNYLNSRSLQSYIIITLGITGMLYSKYQGILIIIFVLLSNIKILKDPKIWLTALGSLLLYTPHLYWQYLNDYPSFKYHLYERSNRSYRIDFTTNHLLNSIAIIGFTFPLVYLSFFKRFKIKDTFEKSLRYIVLGFLIFFLFSSFKNHVQAQWIVLISIPLIISTFYFLIENQKHLKLFKKLAYINISILIIARIIMIFPILPRQLEMHGNKKWVSRLENKIKEQTPIFINSYQLTSLFWFYSKKRPYQYNTYNSRKNQYDLFEYNKKFEKNESVLVNISRNRVQKDSILHKNNKYIFLKNNNKRIFNSKELKINFTEDVITLKNNSKNTFEIQMKKGSDIDLSEVVIKIFIINKHSKKTIENVKISNKNTINFECNNIPEKLHSGKIYIIGSFDKNLKEQRLSSMIRYKVK